MNSLIFSVWVLVIAFFHRRMRRYMRQGNIKTGFCAMWCIDAIFAICGTVVSFVLYGYKFQPFFTLRNGILVLVYLLLAFLFVLATPSGLALLRKKKLSEEAVLTAECRLNDTLGIVRNCFLVMLFSLPILFVYVRRYEGMIYLSEWKETDVCGGFCFVAFLVLIPVCLRQAVFWLRNLSEGEVIEEKLLLRHRKQLQYRHKNKFL